MVRRRTAGRLYKIPPHRSMLKGGDTDGKRLYEKARDFERRARNASNPRDALRLYDRAEKLLLLSLGALERDLKRVQREMNAYRKEYSGLKGEDAQDRRMVLDGSMAGAQGEIALFFAQIRWVKTVLDGVEEQRDEVGDAL